MTKSEYARNARAKKQIEDEFSPDGWYEDERWWENNSKKKQGRAGAGANDKRWKNNTVTNGTKNTSVGGVNTSSHVPDSQKRQSGNLAQSGQTEWKKNRRRGVR